VRPVKQGVEMATKAATVGCGVELAGQEHPSTSRLTVVNHHGGQSLRVTSASFYRHTKTITVILSDRAVSNFLAARETKDAPSRPGAPFVFARQKRLLRSG
jgi:hypothetical protein